MKNRILNNGVAMPEIGYGTWKASAEVTVEAVKLALTNGHNHIDAAAVYGNEVQVGMGIKESGVAREDIFITGKLWNDVRGYDETVAAFNKTCEDLQVDYLDQYIIHWPVPAKYREDYIAKNIESYKAMEDLYKVGKIKSIGVSNFKIHHIEELMAGTTIKPMVNQIEFHPSCLQTEVRDFCAKEDIAIVGYSPLANGKVFDCEELTEFATKYDVTVAQLCVKYALQHNVIPLVKSVNVERIRANLQLDFTIADEDMAAIDAITTCGGSNNDSDNITF